MNVQEILDGKVKVLEFLREKGLKEEKNYPEEEYTEGTYFRIDSTKLLVVYESSEERLKEIKDHFLIDRGLSYCLFILEQKLIFLRSFGESKYFLYSERTKNIVSKIDKLNRIDTQGFDFVFQAGKDVSAIFYEEFKTKRDVLVQNIRNDADPVQKYLMAQKIFDRVFFIYFICHKGIVKVNGKKISGKNLFEVLLKEKDFFKALKNLFYKFNVTGEDRVIEIDNYIIHIPYLNGGLFRPDIFEEELDISLSNDKWAEIFVFLNSFHWIIEDVRVTEENEDRVLTPEILGHVYERSVVEWEIEGLKKEAENAIRDITERKKKGVYYTPESITSYISSKAVANYLIEKLGNKYSSLEELLQSKNETDKKHSLEILDCLKILDPACGSGAFLIKASEILFNLKRRLNYELRNKKNSYDLKLNIITENVYGVDILAGAIEISKLRLWLWLISDYEESVNAIKALPNIEYNLRVGNSLVGWLNEKLVQVPFITPLTPDVERIFKRLRNAAEGSDIVDIDMAKDYLGKYIMDDYIEAYYLLQKVYRKTHGEEAEQLRKILEIIRKSIYSSITPAFLDYVNNKIKPKYNGKNPPLKSAEFGEFHEFHWRIDFGHILRDGGFDVVIGNPPYVRQEELSEAKNYFRANYATYQGTADLFVYFFERELNLLKGKGSFAMIVSNKWLRAGYGRKLREFLVEFWIEELIDFGDLKVFADATIYPCIILIKAIKNCNKKIRICKMETLEFGSLEEYIKNNSFFISQSDLSEKEWNIQKREGNELIKKIESSGLPIEKYAGTKIRRGILTGLNEAFIVDETQRNEFLRKNSKNEELIKPFLTGAECKRYAIKSKNNYIILTKMGVEIMKYPSIYKHLSSFQEALEKRWDKGNYWYELRACAYYDLFSLPKIVWGNLSTRSSFSLDETNGFYVNAPACILPTNSRYVLGVLNSKLMSYFLKSICAERQGGFIEQKPVYVSRVPIKKPTEAQEIEICEHVKKMLQLNEELLKIGEKLTPERVKIEEQISQTDAKIDEVIFNVYGITEAEKKIIERS